MRCAREDGHMLGADTTPLITEARVFEEDWLPTDFQYRSGELEAMSAALRPLVDSDRAAYLFCHGPSGAGKTSTTRHLLNQLTSERADIETVSVSCLSRTTSHSVLYGLLSNLGTVNGIHPSASSTTQLLDRLETTLSGPTVVVLDEADQIGDLDVLFRLYEQSEVSLVLIANADEQFFARMDDRLRSRLQSIPRVGFDRYSTTELVGILDQRVEAGMAPGVVTEAQLCQVADAAVGNARDAITILETAARHAESHGEETLSSARITEAVPAARQQIRAETIDRLDEHHTVLYEIIREAGEIAPGEAYDAYKATVDDPCLRRTVRTYVSKLEHYGLVETMGQNRGRMYRHLDLDDRSPSSSDE